MIIIVKFNYYADNKTEARKKWQDENKMWGQGENFVIENIIKRPRAGDYVVEVNRIKNEVIMNG